MDFVEICNVCTRKVIIKAAKRIFNSDKICRSYCDFYFGVTFFGTHCSLFYSWYSCVLRAVCDGQKLNCLKSRRIIPLLSVITKFDNCGVISSSVMQVVLLTSHTSQW